MPVSKALYEATLSNAREVDAKVEQLYDVYVEDTGSPIGSLTPEFIGQWYYDTTNKDFYVATDTSANTDWAAAAFPDLSPTELNFLDGATAGTVMASKTLVASATKTLAWTTTSASTSGGTSVEPLSMTNTMTGVGGVGGRAKFRLDTNVALGGWANALKAHTVFGATGRVTGLGSALVAELQLSAGTTQGKYAPLESELVLPSGASLGSGASFLFCNVDDDGTTFNDDGFFFELGAGITDTAGGLFDANAKSAINMTHVLKVRISGTIYYLPLHTSIDFGV